jgi:hypothetical protein
MNNLIPREIAFLTELLYTGFGRRSAQSQRISGSIQASGYAPQLEGGIVKRAKLANLSQHSIETGSFPISSI